MAGGDGEDPEIGRLLIARDGEQTKPKSIDGEVLVHNQLATGEKDSVPFQKRIKHDGVAVLRIHERLAKGAGAAVVGVGDGDGGAVRA